MALQRTPPNVFSSSPDLSGTMELESDYVNKTQRKRKQPDSDTDLEFLNEKFGQQLILWNQKLETCIQESIAKAIGPAMASHGTKITTALTELNASMIKLNEDNANINKTLKETNNQLNVMEKSISFVSERQDVFESRLVKIENDFSQLANLPIQVNTLENKIASLEQQARQCNMEISNMPERNSENLLGILDRMCREIGCQINKTDVVAIHRVPHADQKNPHPKNVIVKFTTRIIRDHFIAAYRSKKGLLSTTLGITGSEHKIYCNEHLTLANKLLFRKCREAATKYQYKYVWIKHGTILTRQSDTSSVIAVRSLQDISKIK